MTGIWSLDLPNSTQDGHSRLETPVLTECQAKWTVTSFMPLGPCNKKLDKFSLI